MYAWVNFPCSLVGICTTADTTTEAGGPYDLSVARPTVIRPPPLRRSNLLLSSLKT